MSTALSNAYSPLTEMKLIAQGKTHDALLSELNGKNVENQSRLFLAAQARNELQRIIKLTNFLDTIENKFMTAVNKKLVEQPDNINLLMTTMNIVSQSLERSNALINNVLKDNSLQTLVVNNVNLVNGSDETNIISRKSRDAIRSVASKLISELQSDRIIDLENTENINDNNTTNIETSSTTDEIDDKISELLGD
jgi:hypothetical protein